MTKDEKNQLEDLASKLGGVTITYDVSDDGRTSPYSIVDKRELHLLPVESGSLMAALHELGHIATTPADHRDDFDSWMNYMLDLYDPKEVEYEARAWAWAIEAVDRPLRDDERELIGWSLATYLMRVLEENGSYDKIGKPAEKELAKVVAVAEPVNPEFPGMNKWAGYDDPGTDGPQIANEITKAWYWATELSV